MVMPALKLGTSATVELAPHLDERGGDIAIVIIKQRFTVDRRQHVTRTEGASVVLADVPWDEDKPESSSVKYPCDVCVRKPGTDVVLVGSAVGQGRPRVNTLDVFVRVGPVQRLLKVHGTRVWYRGGGGLTLTRAEPFEEQPLKWELAWGGSDFSDPKHPLEEPQNPVGRGVARSHDSLIHQPGPSIEDAARPITGPRSNVPAGVGAIGPFWEPRRKYVGTMDECWKRERMPLRPVDFDERHNQVAPLGMIVPGYLRGGEPVEMLNVNENGPFKFALPRLEFYVGAVPGRGAPMEYPTVLDTVVLEPNESRLDLTWRTVVPLYPSAPGTIQVHEKEIL